MRKFSDIDIGTKDEQWEAIDGVISYVESELIEVVKKTLHIQG